jgi:transposase
MRLHSIQSVRACKDKVNRATSRAEVAIHAEGSSQMNTYPLGIDVAQLKLEVVLLEGETVSRQTVDNTVMGFEALHAWMQSMSLAAETVHVCLEATGHYGDAVGLFFQAHGYRVSVVNPAAIKAYAQLVNARRKNDRIDAYLIARYCQTHRPALWKPLDPAILDLRTKVRHLAALEKTRQQLRNRLKARLPSPEVQASLQTLITQLDHEIARFKRLVQTYLSQQPPLKAVRQLLTSIPGISDLTAARLIAEIGDISRFDSPEQLVAFVGLDPTQHQSGTSVHHPAHISKKGNTLLRAALYFPAISAKNHNPIIRRFCARLDQRGKPKQEQVVAAMRKLLHLVFGIWNSGEPFDPHFGGQTA